MDRRDQPDVDFRIAEGTGVTGDDHVAGDRNRHAASPHRAVDGSDGRLTHAILGIVEREIQPFEEFLGLDSGLAPDDVQIEPGAKHLVCAADDDGAHRFVVPRFRHRRQQRVDQVHAERIDRRAIEHDLGNIARNGITNEIGTHAVPPLA